MNPFDPQTWVSLAREIIKALFQEVRKHTADVSGTIAGIPVDLHMRLRDGNQGPQQQ